VAQLAAATGTSSVARTLSTSRPPWLICAPAVVNERPDRIALTVMRTGPA
jgi:hypothetical protein